MEFARQIETNLLTEFHRYGKGQQVRLHSLETSDALNHRSGSPLLKSDCSISNHAALRPFKMARFLSVFLFVSFISAQTNPASIAARRYRETHERAIIDEYFQLLSIPNIATDQVNIRRNADFIVAMLKKRGVAAQLVEAPDVNPVVFGEIRTPGATRTIVFYAHYDGQPLDPKEWATPPFSPVLRDGRSKRWAVIPLPAAKFDPESRIYARSAGDDKAPIIAMLAALDSGAKPKSNIKFVFEGEEEAGSPNLGNILEAHKALFSGDVWLICDGPVHQTRRQLIAFGARGITQVDVTVYGPRRELHSGHYGNWAPNPAMMLVKALSSLKDDSGKVLIDHFYDGIAPLSATEKRAIAEAPDFDEELKKELWLGSTEGAPKKLIEFAAIAVTEYSGDGEFAGRGAGIERDSIHRDRDHRYASGEGHGSYERRWSGSSNIFGSRDFLWLIASPARKFAWPTRGHENRLERRRIQRRPHVHGSADFAGSDSGGGKRARPIRQSADDGRQRAAGGD